MWVFALRITNRGLGFIRTIILARLLAPEDFGLLGIAMLSISTLETFSQTGFDTALIQKKENIESYLDTAWTVTAFRGIMLFLILFLSAPTVAEFFNSQQAVLIIQVVSFSLLLSGLKNIGIMFFQKELEFNKQFFYEFPATIIDLLVAVTLGFLFRNAWALVCGGIAAGFVRLFISYIIHPYRPRIKVEKGKFIELFGFGKWMLGSSILVFLITQGDDIFVGKMIGITALGFYQMAYTLSNLPTTEITNIMARVTFPAYSKLQDNTIRFKEAYLKVLQLTLFFSMPLAGLIFVLSSEFTHLFLSDKWVPIIPLIQVLSIAGLLRSIAATTGPVFYSLGKPKIDTTWQIIRLVILISLIYPFTLYWGLIGTSLSIVISILISTVGFSLETINLTRCEARPFCRAILFPLINTIILITIILILKGFLNLTAILQFILLAGAGSISYIALACLFEKQFDYGLRRILGENSTP